MPVCVRMYKCRDPGVHERTAPVFAHTVSRYKGHNLLNTVDKVFKTMQLF